MKRVAVFGNAGGGKSTLARRLAELTRLPLYPLDMVQFRVGRDKVPHKVPHEEYLQAHADLVRREEWIIDGFGCVGVRLGAVRRGRYASLRRSAALHSLRLGYQSASSKGCS